MRIAWGAPPTDAAFDPEAEGWTRVKFPNPYLLQAMGFPVGILTAFLLFLAWSSIPPERLRAPTLGLGFLAPVIVLPLVAFSTICLHELLHSLGHPQLGFSRATYIGVWPSRLLFYAVHLGPIGKTRCLVLGLLPFVMISLAPLVLCLMRDIDLGLGLPLMLASVLNGFFSCGDLVIFPIIAWQVPRNASLRDQGWDVYWKMM